MVFRSIGKNDLDNNCLEWDTLVTFVVYQKRR